MELTFLDIGVLALFAFFMLAGWYAGFLKTLFSLGAYVLACSFALLFRPVLTNAFKQNESIYQAALYYAEGAELVGDVELARTKISNISSEQLAGIMETLELPFPMEARITENVAQEAFLEEGASTLGEYFNYTIVHLFFNILSVLVLFLIIRMLLAFAIHLFDFARMGYPVLHMADGPLAACFGLIRGFLAMFIILLPVPVGLIVLSSFGHFITDSFFGNFFYSSNFLLRLIPGA